MKLVETNIYKLKVGLFVHQYNVSSGLGGIGRMALPGSYVMYDYHYEPTDSYIFRILHDELDCHYVRVPAYMLEDMVEEKDV